MQPEQNNDTAVDNDTSRVSEEASKPTENIMAQGNSSIKKKKNGKTGIVLGFILLFLLAAGGVGFGVWAMMNGNAKEEQLNVQIDTLKKQNDTLMEENSKRNDGGHNEETAEVMTIDNNLASNLIAPYVKPITTWTNVFNYDFNEDLKVKIAALNLSAVSEEVFYTETRDDFYYRVDYYTINVLFKKLFGVDMAKKNYAIEDGRLSITYDEQTNHFIVRPFVGGGTGGEQFSAVKDAYYSGDYLVVEVYHDVASWCHDDGDEDPCIVRGEMTGEEYAQKYGSIIPVYKMLFTKDANHYVLGGVEKK